MSLRSRYQLRRGFTLLEIILTMSIVAVIAMVLYSAMQVTIRAQRSAARTVTLTRSATLALDMAAHDLMSTPAPKGQLAGPFLVTRVAADESALEFYALGRDWDESVFADGVRLVALELRSEPGGGRALVRTVRRNLLATTAVTSQEEVLCRNVRAFSARLFDGSTWGDSWDSTAVDDVLPQVVELVIEVADPDRPDEAPMRLSRLVAMSCASAPAAPTDEEVAP